MLPIRTPRTRRGRTSSRTRWRITKQWMPSTTTSARALTMRRTWTSTRRQSTALGRLRRRTSTPVMSTTGPAPAGAVVDAGLRPPSTTRTTTWAQGGAGVAWMTLLRGSWTSTMRRSGRWSWTTSRATSRSSLPRRRSAGRLPGASGSSSRNTPRRARGCTPSASRTCARATSRAWTSTTSTSRPTPLPWPSGWRTTPARCWRSSTRWPTRWSRGTLRTTTSCTRTSSCASPTCPSTTPSVTSGRST
mmetsp:Transcript_38248/g.120779  ORF Transcript_38248/g.120779 Transcript_38248/m.120779 type:complete len:247 (+) Transcript_38248:208-948(+)